MKAMPGAGVLVSVMLTAMFVAVIVGVKDRHVPQPVVQGPELDSIVSWMPWLDSLKIDKQRFCTRVKLEDLPNLKESASIQASWKNGELFSERLRVLDTYVVENC